MDLKFSAIYTLYSTCASKRNHKRFIVTARAQVDVLWAYDEAIKLQFLHIAIKFIRSLLRGLSVKFGTTNCVIHEPLIATPSDAMLQWPKFFNSLGTTPAVLPHTYTRNSPRTRNVSHVLRGHYYSKCNNRIGEKLKSKNQPRYWCCICSATEATSRLPSTRNVWVFVMSMLHRLILWRAFN